VSHFKKRDKGLELPVLQVARGIDVLSGSGEGRCTGVLNRSGSLMKVSYSVEGRSGKPNSPYCRKVVEPRADGSGITEIDQLRYFFLFTPH
jgi:hypothetical protein